MASQIEQLRASFGKMNTTQQKAFIDNLKQKLKGSTNAEYTKFLSECVQKYNMAVRGDSPVATPQKTVGNNIKNNVVANKTISKKSKKGITTLKLTLFTYGVVMLCFSAFLFIGSNYDANRKNYAGTGSSFAVRQSDGSANYHDAQGNVINRQVNSDGSYSDRRIASADSRATYGSDMWDWFGLIAFVFGFFIASCLIFCVALAVKDSKIFDNLIATLSILVGFAIMIFLLKGLAGMFINPTTILILCLIAVLISFGLSYVFIFQTKETEA